jgi:RNA polymerase nonessential primary-like sigma factor
MKMTPGELSVLLKAQERVTSTDVLVGVNRDTPLSEILPSELLSPDELLLVEDDADYARQLLDCCTDQQRQIISLRFGLDDATPLTWKQVGEHMGLSREKVRQLQIAGFHRIRKKEETRNYES